MKLPKTTERLVEKWYDKLPVTLRETLDNIPDKSKFTPAEVLKEAFLGLSIVDNIKEVKVLFPKECEGKGIFSKLKDYKKTKATEGILSVYREFKELYENGILKNGEDITIYLLKKLFLETKSRKQVNQDLEKDLIDDVKNEFNRKFPKRKGEYIGKDTFIKAFGIKRLDPGVQSFFRYTDEEYCEKASQTHKEIWSRLTPEQKNERVSVLQQKYKEWIAKLSEEQKEKWLKDRVNNWKKLSPEQKTDLIIKLKAAGERQRYAMYDAWNKSEDLIMALSVFMKEHQYLKPVDMLFTDEEFGEIQSKIMTDFWDSHSDMAEKFGETLSLSLKEVETAIKEGRFEDLKQKIDAKRAERIKKINAEKAAAEGQKIKDTVTNKLTETKPAEESKIKETAANKQAEEKPAPIIVDYREEFRKAYRNYYNADRCLPASYVDEIIDIMLNGLPQDVIEKITESCKSGAKLSDDLLAEMRERGSKDKITSKMERNTRALEAAIAHEMCEKGASPDFYNMSTNTIINIYKKAVKEARNGKKRPNVRNVENYYNQYKEELSDQKAKQISDTYFVFRRKEDYTPEYNKMLEDYIKSYGKSILILFSDKKEYTSEAKSKFNEKFLRLMPEKLKEVFIPILSSLQDIKDEKQIKQIGESIYTRYSFMPKDFRDAYIHEVGNTIRFYRISENPNKADFTVQSYKEKMCKKVLRSDESIGMQYLQIPKNIPSRENKIQILAAEQSLADEIFRITENENAYKFEVEPLCNFFEIFCRIKSEEIINASRGEEIKFSVKNRAEQRNIYSRYIEYLEKLNDNADKIFDGDNIKDTEMLLSILSKDTDNNIRKENIKKRIEAYLD